MDILNKEGMREREHSLIAKEQLTKSFSIITDNEVAVSNWTRIKTLIWMSY